MSSDAAVLSQVAAAMEGAAAVETPFTRQIVQAYRDGVEFLVCADLERVTAKDGKDADLLGNVKYLVASQKQVSGKPDTRYGEFRRPPSGLAAWLANPSPTGALIRLSGRQHRLRLCGE
jgi:hypothetical protein